MKPVEEGRIAYSNFDHKFRVDEVHVRTSGKYHQHSAWNFQGHIWYDASAHCFYEEIWQNNVKTDTLSGITLASLIKKVIKKYDRE
jgi:hypothetical protein